MAEVNPIQQIAIIGINAESAALLPSLLDTEGVQIVKILNHQLEDLFRLTQFPHLNFIVDTSGDPAIAEKLRKLPFKNTQVVGGITARILFCGGKRGLLHGFSLEFRHRILQMAREMREAVNLSRNKEEILKVVLRTAVQSLGADAGSVMLLDVRKRQVRVETSQGLAVGPSSSIRKAGTGVSGHVTQTGSPLLIQGPLQKQTYGSDYERTDIVSSICCPLLFAGEVFGVLNISSLSRAKIFTEDDVQFLQAFADLTAEIIHTSNELETNRTSSFSLSVLDSVREILGFRYRLDERMNLIMMKLANAFGAKACNYYEFHPVSRAFTLRASSSFSLNLGRGRPQRLSEFFAKRIIGSRNTQCVHAQEKGSSQRTWFVAQPVRAGGLLAGALCLQMRNDKQSLKEEASILRRIAELLGREFAKHREMEGFRIQSLRHAAVSEFAFDAARAETLEELQKIILSNACLILEAETCLLRLRNPIDDSLEIEDHLCFKNPIWLKEIRALDTRILESAPASPQPLLIVDLDDSPFAQENLCSDSVLAMRLEAEGRCEAWISLYDRKAPDVFGSRRFTERDKEIFACFCQQALKAVRRLHGESTGKRAAARLDDKNLGELPGNASSAGDTTDSCDSSDSTDTTDNLDISGFSEIPHDTAEMKTIPASDE